MNDAVIQLNSLVKRFKGMDKPAVAPLNCTIRKGYVTGLVGPDGAGKTTLMRMLAGLLKPDEGSARVLGLDPIKDDGPLHAMLGYMPQKFGLYEDLTVMENLNLYADLRSVTGETREKTFARLLEFTSLGPFTDRLAGKLSGGMKQKLGLACTLVGEPKVLLLDEPGVGVDPISRRELWQMVHELAGDGMLILWSTSYLDEAEQCRDVLLMNEGELLYQGEPTTLTQSMAGRSFLLHSPQASNRSLLQRVLRLPQVSDGMIQGRSVRVILKKEATVDDIRRAPGMPTIEMEETAPRFEDAFIDLLGGAGTSESPLGAILHTVEGTPGETVIEAKSLTKKFGDFAATDNVNFAVKRGEIFGLLGPNGAGKSTTFKMMCGLLVPTSGKALVLDMDLKVSSGKARQHLGYMAQKFSLYGNLTVEQNLRFFSGVYGLRGRAQNEKIRRMSDAFGLTNIASHATDELPLGFKQRLALACSLMHEPDILFLDEPTSGVDPITRREFWLHINSMVEKGVTVMVTTHFMDEAEYCDRIGLVYRGKLIAHGTPDDLKNQAADDEVPDPTMEQAFITLIHDWDKENAHAQ
ncbi:MULTISPECIES: ATP-binding cassette domain-containing protein [Enterobacter]|jgi:ABC-2 type transport system ATP-binding protein|uniref:ATP-binding cassette domain-containing protein n=1 Tax=Enterobacter TaxID=547 RepID=UPI0005EFC7AC|nr:MULTISPECIES: ATP-binding cassette domain-containing protein [Enterobacter]ELN9579768.1 ABC transporter ATP-binding protein [Enterobacter roggenkampii]KJM47616.1 multidrug ABC transporter ATP-binding protein [Enterobacter roggenkampii]MBO4174278.1 ABC transporter ATP-binding protein [Enterobacter roggenkampii]MCK6713986.1 ATP-binding cassette domain-containing protein [Enterobacter roggenkampii]MCK7354345.1 ATP-binding cassette domain-containing protein [Enterobacter roggenkampii]